ncbi:MAG: EamA family transporter [Alphaproteobacteria bacterium]
MIDPQRWSGIAMALMSAALFGASTPLAKLLLGSIDPWLLAGMLYLGAGVGLLLVHVMRAAVRLAAPEAPLRRSDIPWMAAIVLSGGVIGPVLLMFGLARSDAASASLLLNLEALATMAIAWLAYREYVDRRLLLGAAAILAGAILISWQDGASIFSSGALLIAGACVAWGVDNNLTRKLSTADPVQIAMIKGIVAGIVNLTLAFAAGANIPAASIAAGAAILGFFGYGVSLALFVLALRHLGTARTGAYFSVAPFIGALTAVAAIGEHMTVQLAVAGGLMAFGLYLHLAERHAHEHVHVPMEHEHRHVHDEHHRHAHDPADPPGEPHSHRHRHERLSHRHPHFPDIHHRHPH